MGRCYIGDHTAVDHIHTDMTTCNIEEPQLMYRLGTVSKRILEVMCVCLGGGGERGGGGGGGRG